MDNKLKLKLRADKCTKGIFLLSASSMIAEACSIHPIDWLMFDMEASPIGRSDLLHLLQSLNGSDVTPLVRVNSKSKHDIEQVLDLGVSGILVPKVDTKLEAMAIVDATKFPPMGNRGVNPVRASAYFTDVMKYFRTANETILCMVQIESRAAVDNAHEIASVEGIDLLFIGCGDLSMSFGQPGIMDGKLMDEARQIVLAACRRNNKVPGIFAYSTELAIQYAQEGFQFIALGNDLKALNKGLSLELDSFSQAMLMLSAQ